MSSVFIDMIRAGPAGPGPITSGASRRGTGPWRRRRGPIPPPPLRLGLAAQMAQTWMAAMAAVARRGGGWLLVLVRRSIVQRSREGDVLTVQRIQNWGVDAMSGRGGIFRSQGEYCGLKTEDNSFRARLCFRVGSGDCREGGDPAGQCRRCCFWVMKGVGLCHSTLVDRRDRLR